jgi:ABC-type glutathione transport system ATPase component
MSLGSEIEPLVDCQELSLSVSKKTETSGIFSAPGNVEKKEILSSISFSIKKGEIVAIVGESGSGKTSLLRSALGILPKNSEIKYSRYQILGEDWNNWKKDGWERFRGNRVSFIPQNPISAFHPFRRMGDQIQEAYRFIKPVYAEKKKILETWEEFGIRDPKRAFISYPHSLSGGEKQRICIALAHFSDSDIILADEPTTALDPILAKKILDLLVGTVRKKGVGMAIITHDLVLMERIADEVLVIKSGKMVEKNTKSQGKFSPWTTEYTNRLAGARLISR